MRLRTQYENIADVPTEKDDYQSFKERPGSMYGLDPTKQVSGGHHLRRFHFRTFVGVLGPIIVTAYYILIWRLYIAPVDPNNPLIFGLPGATWVYYSWFIAGIIGLNLSLYGLAGVEAAMLMEPAWQVSDALQLIMHADATWSGPGGWIKTAQRLFRISKASGHNKLPGRLWWILALPSMVVFAAWPLSGLSFETTAGWVHGRGGGAGPTVIGFSYDNFNERHVGDAPAGAGVTWQYALDARVPGQGIVYTPEGFDRSQIPFLEKLLVVFPKDDGTSRLFLTAQAMDAPIEGKSWGMLVEYNCSIVKNASQLTLLKNRNRAVRTANGTIANPLRTIGAIATNDTSVTAFNQTDSSWASNMVSVIEVGTSQWPNQNVLDQMLSDSFITRQQTITGCYFNTAENQTGDYPGIDQPSVLEVIVWQHLFPSEVVSPVPKYDLSVDHNITDLYGVYDLADFDPLLSSNNLSTPLTAVGGRCTSSSSVGTADIDGVHSTYSNFVRTDTKLSINRARCAERFDSQRVGSILGVTSSGGWLQKLFSSAAAPPILYAPYSDDPNNIDIASGVMLQLSYLQSSQLRQSLLQAHAAYATQLMYSGGQGLTSRDGSRVGFTNPNVTDFRRATVLKPGIVPAYLPASLFFIWALFGPVFGLIYGFRRRWSAMLDGYSLFRVGMDLSQETKGRIEGYSNTEEVERCRELENLPGLIGDTRTCEWLGHVGLVGVSGYAEKGKVYH